MRKDFTRETRKCIRSFLVNSSFNKDDEFQLKIKLNYVRGYGVNVLLVIFKSVINEMFTEPLVS